MNTQIIVYHVTLINMNKNLKRLKDRYPDIPFLVLEDIYTMGVIDGHKNAEKAIENVFNKKS